MRQDIIAQLADYRGVLGWNASAGKWPDIEIPLYIKEHPLPTRKQKISEITTVPEIDAFSGMQLGVSYVFYGSPDLLSIAISGWTITPIVAGVFTPKDKTGANLSLGNVSYPEIIDAFLSGTINANSSGSPLRKDPDYYITPYGHQYNTPIISQFDTQYGPTMKKQPFNMTLLLEK